MRKKTSSKVKIVSALSKKPMSTAQLQSKVGVRRISARIHDLRKDGVDILTVKTTGGRNAGKYVYELV